MVHKRWIMAERKAYDRKLVEIGELLRAKRVSLGPQYNSRERFIEQRSIELFDNSDWISLRHLSNIELGKNMISLEMLLVLSDALEEDVVSLFSEIVSIYKSE